MKKVLLICLVALSGAVFSNEIPKDSKTISNEQIVAKNSLKIGYYVFIKKDKKVYQKEFNNIEHVYLFIGNHFPLFCADIEEELNNSPALMQVNNISEIYVEKQKIVNGKYKRLKKKDLDILYPKK